MRFFKQKTKGTCNIIAIQHALSFFDMYPTFKEIRKDLPFHEFGSWLPEIGMYFEARGIKTKLISNSNEFISHDKLFVKVLDEYKKKGEFKDRIIVDSDIEKGPVIISVDALKIIKKQGIPGSHYVVLVNEEEGYCIYDGEGFDDKVRTTFNEIYKASLDINKFHENGMWLFLK